MRRLLQGILCTAAVLVAACVGTGDVNGPGVTATADITGKWAGHADGQNNADSITASLTQASGTIVGGGIYWLASSPEPVKISGVRVKDSLYLTMPDSTGSPKDTLKFIGIITKDAIGDEFFGQVGVGNFNAGTGVTFLLHRRP